MVETTTSYFDDETLAGENQSYAQEAQRLKESFGFDFVAIGLTPFFGAPLRWVYTAGATSDRFRRIVLAPGHGIGGIVIKTGKPMLAKDIDDEIDPREYSSYPIVFAEELRSFCCLPLTMGQRAVAALLLGFRSVDPYNELMYSDCMDALSGRFCGFGVRSEGFLHLDETEQLSASAEDMALPNRSALSRVIQAQESERMRISREIHDGISQELLVVSFHLRQLESLAENEQQDRLTKEANAALNEVIDELHNLSVDLRPSSLDHFGLVAALRAQAQVYERTYGVYVVFSGDEIGRFDPAFETQIYRICQEAILNSCKYSGDDVVCVDFSKVDGWIQVVITDEGEGFNTEHPTIRGSGCGLSGMRERAAMMGATLEIESGDFGTKVHLVAPMPAVSCEEEAK